MTAKLNCTLKFVMKCWTSIDNSNNKLLRNTILVLFILIAFANFLPLLLGNTLKDKVTNQYPSYFSEYDSSYFSGSLYASIGAAFPLVLDYAAEICIGLPKPSYHHLIPRREIFLALILPDIFELVYVIPYKNYDLMPGLIGMRDTLYIYAFLLYMSKSEFKIWNLSNTILIAICFGVSNVLRSFQAGNSDFNYLKNSLTAIQVFVSVAFLNFVLIYVMWFRHVNELKDEASKRNFLLQRVYAVCFFIFILGDWIVFYIPNIPPEWLNVGASYLTMYTYLMSICTVTVTIVISKLAQLESLETERVLSTKKTFMRYISHEIRTPLSSLNMGLVVLTKDIEKLPNNSKFVSTINELESCCGDAIEILNDFLLSDKLENGLLKLELEYSPITVLVREVVNKFLFHARSKNIQLTFESQIKNYTKVRGKILNVYVDKSKIKQVLRNLVSNAIKFTSDDGFVMIHISFEAVNVPFKNEKNNSKIYNEFTLIGKISISVTDSGAGISEENMKNLFQEYSQFNPGQLQQGGGSGLGLFISKKIISMHDGDISFHSDGEGKGSTVTLTMSVFESENKLENNNDISLTIQKYVSIDNNDNNDNESEGDISNTLESPDIESGFKEVATTYKYPTALLVDDSKLNIKMLSKLLASDFSELLLAYDGLEAIEQVKRCVEADKNIDVILMDYEMPKMNGITSIMELRNTLHYTGLIIGLTGNALSDDLDHMTQAGADYVLVKPIDIDKLFRHIEEFNAFRNNKSTE